MSPLRNLLQKVFRSPRMAVLTLLMR